MIEALEKKMIHDVLDSVQNTRFQSDFENAFIHSPEDNLIAFAKSWASYYEVYNNSLVFPDAYTKLLKNIEKRAIDLQIPSVS